MAQEIKEKAFELRSQGYSYRDINKMLGISKGSLNYWFSKEGKDKQKKRTNMYRQNPEMKYRIKIQKAGFNVKDIDNKSLIKYILKYKSFCYICGEKIDIFNEKHDLDHFYPKSKGGNNSLDNMHPTHSDCNFMKGSMEINNFLQKIKKVYEYQNLVAYKIGKNVISINNKNVKKYIDGNFNLHKPILPIKK